MLDPDQIKKLNRIPSVWNSTNGRQGLFFLTLLMFSLSLWGLSYVYYPKLMFP